MPIPVLFQDPFSPKLLTSPVLPVTEEQKMYVRKVLDKACSDSRFADKAYVAIAYILSGGSVVVPNILSLSPSSAEVGDPDFTLHVHGTGFTPTSKIFFNGGEEPTTYVSASELTTGVSMATVSGASVVPVNVVSADGVSSTPLNFTFTI
jgi:hypothetical protein